MKELDKTKAYDLRDLNDEQLKELLNYMRSNFEKWQKSTIIFDDSILIYRDDRWWQGCIEEAENLEVVSGKTLFEPQLKIGDTFEKDGFICRVESVKKEPIKVGDWIMNDRKMFFKYEKWMCDSPLWVKITDQEFIKQLEKHAR